MCREMYRKPAAISRTPARRAAEPSSGGSAGSRWTAHTVTQSASASTRYSSGSPITGMSTPASSGPATRPVCITVEPSALAAGSCSAGTRAGDGGGAGGRVEPEERLLHSASRTMRTPTESRPVTACAQNSSEVTAIPVLVTSSSVAAVHGVGDRPPPHSAKATIGTSPARLA
ncbi:hypothetical protein GCM10017687_46680 [Streptomyces echinatus]